MGFRISMDAGVRVSADGTLIGGSPARGFRLTAAGTGVLAALRNGPVDSAGAGVLARKLTDAGFAHPQPPLLPGIPDVTVVVPVRDRAEALGRCLAALGRRYPVIVVDDGSRAPGSVADVVARHGATLIRRPVNGGAGPARNTGLERVGTEFVAFVDSDCESAGDWIDRLAAHFADPLVAAVAPRIVARSTSSGVRGISEGALDLGDQPARVVPDTRVSYVPTAALLVRTAALTGRAFDETIGRGEDVDLVWRLHEAGWRIRYDPSVTVGHSEPTTWSALLARRFRYGRSAGPLAVRHPGSAPPLVLYPLPTVAVAALLARRPAIAAVAYGCAVLTAVRRSGASADGVPKAMLGAVYQTWLGIGRYAVRFAAPALAVALAAPGSTARRVAVASLVFGPPLAAWLADGRAHDPVRFVAGRLADEIAYGAGVWSGCVTARTTKPVRPSIRWRYQAFFDLVRLAWSGFASRSGSVSVPAMAKPVLRARKARSR
jgi:mycofactocin system glycosyltransferase